MFGIGLEQKKKYFNFEKKNCFEVIQNDNKSNSVLRVWTEVCDRIYGD